MIAKFNAQFPPSPQMQALAQHRASQQVGLVQQADADAQAQAQADMLGPARHSTASNASAGLGQFIPY